MVAASTEVMTIMGADTFTARPSYFPPPPLQTFSSPFSNPIPPVISAESTEGEDTDSTSSTATTPLSPGVTVMGGSSTAINNGWSSVTQGGSSVH